ncbi:cation:dicarboxylase symporter family transporter [Streptomyces sp. NPDC005574]|uniref:cation:dicarboxylate symporter family transporter n=1 Tax=Streptomyces sp. NPDC005574 TaxID=3156891 RepID=UPI0033A8E42A
MTSTAAAGRPQRSRLSRLIRELWFQVVLAAVLGIAVGILAPGLGEDLKPLNDWFIALVKMIVIPVVFCVVSTGIASMDNLRKAGRIGVKAIGYFLVLSLVSMLTGLVVANIFQPGFATVATSSTSELYTYLSEKIGGLDGMQAVETALTLRHVKQLTYEPSR